MSFDRRKTVGDLRLAIYQVAFFSRNTSCCVFMLLNQKAEIFSFCACVVKMQELWEGDMALTVAKSLPAGLHLYSTITGELLA